VISTFDEVVDSGRYYLIKRWQEIDLREEQYVLHGEKTLNNIVDEDRYNPKVQYKRVH